MKGWCITQLKVNFWARVLPSRLLSYTKIVKGESKKNKRSLISFAEPHPVLYKDIKSREEKFEFIQNLSQDASRRL